MTVFKCKMCGGNLEILDGMTICECEYCGSTQTIPALDDEKKISLFTRANRLRSLCEFDKAAGVYETIIAEFPEEAEAYWGLILCKYGIEYVDDPKTGKKIPTCHRSSFDSVMDDENFEFVMEYSEPVSRAVYREEAKRIEELRIGIIEVSSKEEPYDIFICYKESTLSGDRTIDSVIAQDVYDALTEKGYKVFFSRITLEDKLGQEYEPYIFAALNSAKIMLVFGTNYEYYNAVWVKNEWSRFLSLIEKGEKKTLIPCYKGIDAYDMPKEFARLQAQDMGKVGATQDLIRGIGKILGTATSVTNFSKVSSAEGSLLVQRGNMALEDEDFKGAEGYFERALDTNPSDAYAYLGKFLATHGLKTLEDLENKVCILDADKEFRRAEHFADAELANELKKVKESNAVKVERLRLIDALKKYKQKVAISEMGSMKKLAYDHILKKSEDGELKARKIYADLLMLNAVSKSEYSKLIENINIVKGIAYVLGDYQWHLKKTMHTEYPLNKYGYYHIDLVISDMVRLRCLEERASEYYCLWGAEEERERLLKEAEERRLKAERQKSAYEAACTEYELHIQKEAEPALNRISYEFDFTMQAVQQEMDTVIENANKQREYILFNISELQKKQSSLGIFKGKEKKELQMQINNLQNNLNCIASPQQIQAQYQPMKDCVLNDRQCAMDKAIAEVRAKYIKPKLEDFMNV